MVKPASLGVRLPYTHMGLLTHTKYGSLMTYVLSAFWVASSGRNKDSGLDNDNISQINCPHRNVQEVSQKDSRGVGVISSTYCGERKAFTVTPHSHSFVQEQTVERQTCDQKRWRAVAHFHA